jgi:diphthine-ammonia ligase
LKAGILFSGGKDSTYATYLAGGRHDVVCLITMAPSRPDSYMFHHPNIKWTELQSRAMKIPQVCFETAGVKEEELEDLHSAIVVAKERFSIEGLYTGAILSSYQKSRVDRVCVRAGIKSISPLWGIEPEIHLTNLLRGEFSVMFTAVSALGLDAEWLGRILDSAAVDELLELQRRYGLNPTLEGGEGETFVVDCPIFSQRIKINSSKKHWMGDHGYLEIQDAELVSK